MFLHHTSNGVLAKRVAALYLLHFQLKTGRKDIPYWVTAVEHVFYMQVLLGKQYWEGKTDSRARQKSFQFHREPTSTFFNLRPPC